MSACLVAALVAHKDIDLQMLILLRQLCQSIEFQFAIVLPWLASPGSTPNALHLFYKHCSQLLCTKPLVRNTSHVWKYFMQFIRLERRLGSEVMWLSQLQRLSALTLLNKVIIGERQFLAKQFQSIAVDRMLLSLGTRVLSNSGLRECSLRPL